MAYLARHFPLKAAPQELLPTAQSIIVVGCNYWTPAELPFKIARYARGDDYHLLMKSMLEHLVTSMRELEPALEARVFVDSGPLLERELASRAGLGWQGKNTCLIAPGKGSWFLLGCVLSSLPLTADPPFESFHCGSCTRCIDACPTGALLEPHLLDARKCIAYWTIEQRESIPEIMREQTADWLFGCDICQEVCPWNQRFAKASQHTAFYPREWMKMEPLEQLITYSAHDFELKIAPRSPLKRPKYRGFIRNLSVVMGNSANPTYLPALQAALQQHAEDPMLSEHLQWAIKRLSPAATP